MIGVAAGSVVGDAAVGDKVGDVVGPTVGTTVRDKVGGAVKPSVGALVGGRENLEELDDLKYFPFFALLALFEFVLACLAPLLLLMPDFGFSGSVAVELFLLPNDVGATVSILVGTSVAVFGTSVPFWCEVFPLLLDLEPFALDLVFGAAGLSSVVDALFEDVAFGVFRCFAFFEDLGTTVPGVTIDFEDLVLLSDSDDTLIDFSGGATVKVVGTVEAD